jgi:hypothetical protein
MKRMLLLAAIVLSVLTVSGITVFLDTGRDYKGDFTEFRDSLAVLNDEGVTLLIPVSRIKVVVDEGKDITVDFLAKAKKGTGGDAHFLSESVYFVSETEPSGTARTEVFPARLLKPAAEENEMTAEFALLADGRLLQTKYFFKTRPATQVDITKNTPVLFFGAISAKGNYIAPVDKKEAINGNWYMAFITNAATRKQGYVTVTGNARVETTNLRIISE